MLVVQVPRLGGWVGGRGEVPQEKVYSLNRVIRNTHQVYRRTLLLLAGSLVSSDRWAPPLLGTIAREACAMPSSTYRI